LGTQCRLDIFNRVTCRDYKLNNTSLNEMKGPTAGLRMHASLLRAIILVLNVQIFYEGLSSFVQLQHSTCSARAKYCMWLLHFCLSVRLCVCMSDTRFEVGSI